MPPKRSKHAAVLDDLPAATTALQLLHDAGHDQAATAVAHVLDYARKEAEQAIRLAKSSPTNRPITVTKEFRDHVRARAAEEGANPADVVRRSLEDFLDGHWTPPQPVRARRGSHQTRVPLSVRVPDELWDEANRVGSDPQAVKQRGYKLTASSISIAALTELFGTPNTENSATP